MTVTTTAVNRPLATMPVLQVNAVQGSGMTGLEMRQGVAA